MVLVFVLGAITGRLVLLSCPFLWLVYVELGGRGCLFYVNKLSRCLESLASFSPFVYCFGSLLGIFWESVCTPPINISLWYFCGCRFVLPLCVLCLGCVLFCLANPRHLVLSIVDPYLPCSVFNLVGFGFSVVVPLPYCHFGLRSSDLFLQIFIVCRPLERNRLFVLLWSFLFPLFSVLKVHPFLVNLIVYCCIFWCLYWCYLMSRFSLN